MSTLADFTANLNKYKGKKYDMPDLSTLKGIQFPDKLGKFIEVLKSVGGEAVVLEKGEDVNEIIKKLYPEAKKIASNLPEITIAGINPDKIDEPHEYNGIELGIVAGDFGVAENGCVWIPQNVRFKALYFISEYLVVLVKKDQIVNNMHEGYKIAKFSDKGYNLFVSGPSKTADIEQALVVGAHGPKGFTVILY